jgi:hypothetical protein
MRHTAQAAAFAMALGLAAASCSTGGGELVSCVAPGAACCAGDACAVGLVCQNALCVAMGVDGASDAAPTDGSAGDGE